METEIAGNFASISTIIMRGETKWFYREKEGWGKKAEAKRKKEKKFRVSILKKKKIFYISFATLIQIQTVLSDNARDSVKNSRGETRRWRLLWSSFTISFLQRTELLFLSVDILKSMLEDDRFNVMEGALEVLQLRYLCGKGKGKSV